LEADLASAAEARLYHSHFDLLLRVLFSGETLVADHWIHLKVSLLELEALLIVHTLHATSATDRLEAPAAAQQAVPCARCLPVDSASCMCNLQSYINKLNCSNGRGNLSNSCQHQLLHMGVSCKRMLLLAACIRGAYLAGNLLLSHYIADYDTSASLLSESCDDAWPEAVAAAPQQRPWVVWDSVFSHRIAACGYEYEQYFAFFPGFSGELLDTVVKQYTYAIAMESIIQQLYELYTTAAAKRQQRQV
jgi:hypothetical protein